MKAEAYILIQTLMGTEDNVLEKLQEIEEIKFCSIIYSKTHSIITKVETNTFPDLQALVMDKN
ncbi:MAG: Lrp/AsnC family transcriptional regulator [Candidatus Hodarchaeales archaeon]